MRAIVSVFSKDRIGIIADVCSLMAGMRVNILDLSQTVMEDNFTMVMLVDTATSDLSFEDIRQKLHDKGEEQGLFIRIQREDIFDAMHRI